MASDDSAPVDDTQPSLTAARDQRIDKALNFVVSRAGQRSGREFLEALVSFLGDESQAAYAFCGRVVLDRTCVQTLALWAHGKIVPNISYDLIDTPCAEVVDRVLCCYPRDIQSLFPEDTLLADMHAESYAGIPLFSGDGAALGLVVILDTKPFSRPELIKDLLRIIAVSAAAELEREQFEEHLRAEEKRFRDFAEVSSDWFWEMDCDLRFSYFSERVEEVTGVPVSYHIGKTRAELAGENVKTEKWRRHLETLEQHKPFKNFEYVRQGPGGILQYLSTSGTPVFDRFGAFLGYRGTETDISEQKKAEQALLDSERRYELAVRQAAIWDWDLETDRVYFSPKFRELLGYSEDELRDIVDTSVKWLVHPDDLEGYEKKLAVHLEDPETVFDSEHRFRLKSGEYRWCHARGQTVRDSDGKVARSVGLITDITKRKAMETALKQALERTHTAEKRLVTAINALEDGFVLFDKDDRLVLCNEKYKEIYRTSADLLVAGNSFEHIIRIGAERGQYPDAVGRVEAWVAERLATHRAANLETEQRLDDGRWLKISERKTPDGGVVGFRVDITELKRIQEELTIARDTAEKANRAKSEFLASMSHELRTPLNVILGFAQMLQIDTKTPLLESQNGYVDNILQGGTHLLELINDVLDLAKIEADQLAFSIDDVDPREIVTGCLALSVPLGEPRGICIHDELGETRLPRIRTDPLRFKQVVLNLLSNAIKYNREGGSVYIDGAPTEDGFLRLSVRDTGAGIPVEDQASVFHMFHRLKADSTKATEGTGIGLTVSKLLVEKMAGRIGFDSAEGVGSTFWIELPLATNNEVLIWTETMRVGIDPIDKDHQVLISLLNRVTHGFTDERLGDAIIDELIEYAHFHFAREEAIMAACAYPDLDEHHHYHRELETEIQELAAAWRAERNPDLLGSLRRFLRDWLFDHIIKIDSGIFVHAKGKEAKIRNALSGLD